MKCELAALGRTSQPDVDVLAAREWFAIEIDNHTYIWLLLEWFASLGGGYVEGGG